MRSVEHSTPRGVILRLEVPDRVQHLPGQHYVVRLSAPDGYSAQRSYSVASDPADPLVELFVERLPDGEVSGYLADVVRPDDELDVRGPIGGWFVWRGSTRVVGVGGGSGVVPLVAMLRHARRLDRRDLVSIAVSARTSADLPYAAELTESGALIGLTREPAPTRLPGRLTSLDLATVVGDSATTTYFVCGSATFAESMSMTLGDLGVPVNRIRVERFGPTG